MLVVVRQRNFALLLLAGLISSVGDLVLSIVLPFYVYDLTHSALQTGAMFIASSLPGLLVGSVAGVFVDRWDRKHTMVAADLSRVVLMLLLLAVRSRDALWIVYLVAFVESSVSRFFTPAKSAFIPQLVTAERLTAANALDSVSSSIVNLIAPSLGGALLVLLGLSGVVLVDSASFLLSGLLIALIMAPSTGARPVAGSAVASSVRAWAAVWHEWLDGLRLVQQDRLLLTLFTVMGLAMLGQGILTALNVVFVKDVLHGSAAVFGWMVTAAGVGGLIGGMVMGQAGPGMSPARLIALGLGAAGVILVVRTTVPMLPLFLALTALAPVFITGVTISLQTLFQRGVPDQYRGRIFASFGTTTSLLLLGGLGLGSVLGNRLSVVALLDAAGGLFVLSGAVALVWLPTAVRANERSTEAEVAQNPPGNEEPLSGTLPSHTIN
jgi:Na+/melibiose symporter-like transporter